MLDIKVNSDLDKYLGQSFWTWGYYIGVYSYKLSNIVLPQEIILTREVSGTGRCPWYPLKNKKTGQIVGYYNTRDYYSNFKLYESEEEAKEAWNANLQNQLDRLDSEYTKKKDYLAKRFLK